MNGQSFTINSEHTLKCFIEHVTKQWNEHKWMQCTFNYDKARSLKQNSALHVYCGMLAESLNDAGLDMKQVLAHHQEIPWTATAVKERMWRPIQQAMINEDSTTRASTKDYPQIYEALNRHTASRLGISIEWPTKDASS